MPDRDVVSTSREKYGAGFASDLMDQYKLTRSTITDLQNDRNATNRFLIGISTALFGVEGFFLRQSLTDDLVNYSPIFSAILLLIPTLGIYIGYLWVKWSTSYGIALKVRYRLLKGMELHLPGQPFAREDILRKELGYVPISDIMINMARFFMGGFILVLVLAIGRLCF